MKKRFEYLEKLELILKAVFANRQFFAEAGSILKETIQKDGLIYVYGSGHSHMLGEELFYRAGGLANVCPILIEPLMLHEKAARASKLEKKEQYVQPYLDQYEFLPDDAMIVISTSGRNATPIDAALYAKEKNMKVITISSFDFARSQPPQHSGGKYLYDIGDVNLNNLVPIGDACLTCEGIKTPFAPVSTIVNAAVLNALLGETITALAETGRHDVPIFLSGNLPYAAEQNEKLVEKYGKRIKPLA